MSPPHAEVAGGICREQCRPPSVLGTWRCPLPCLQKWCHPILQAPSSVPRHHGGRWSGGKRVNSMRISNVGIFQPPPNSTLPARSSQGCSCVLGVRTGRGHGDMPPALPSPSPPPLVTAPWVHEALLCPRDGMAVWGLKGRAGSPPFTAGTRSVSQNWGHPFPGFEFWRAKIMQGDDPGKAK